MEDLDVNQTCKLCSKSSTNFQTLDETVLMKLNSFLLYPNLTLNDAPLICEACLSNLTHCLNFKTKYFTKENITNSSLKDDKNNLKIKQEDDVCETEEKLTEYASSQCNFCKREDETVTNLQHEDMEVLRMHLSGFELSTTTYLVACTSCQESFKRFVDFIKLILQCKKEYVQKWEPKQEFNIKLEYEEDIKTESAESDSPSTATSTPKKTYTCPLCPYTSKWMHRVKKHFISHKNLSEVKTFSCAECPFVSKYKKSITNHVQIHVVARLKPVVKCELCNFTTTTERNLKRHVERHSKLLPKPHKCTECDFETKYLINLQVHLQQHKDPKKTTTYACDKCEFFTIHKALAKKHKLKHKAQDRLLREVKSEKLLERESIFTCYICDFEAGSKGKLGAHVKVAHKPLLDSDVYKCKFCVYTTADRACLQKHVRRHIEATHDKKFWCKICNFETNYSSSLRSHMLLHDSSYRDLKNRYTCPECEFSSWHASALRKHALVHKSSEEILWYTCDICGFKAKRKNTLRIHIRKHQNAAEVELYKCPLCEYKSKRKDVLKQHQKTHQSLDEMVSYKCEFCDHRSKRKEHMELHVLTHKSESEVEIFKCNLCDFQTKYKMSFNKHKFTRCAIRNGIR